MSEFTTVKDLGWEKIKDEVAKFEGAYVKIGVLATAKATEDGFNLARLAAVHEYGKTIKHPGGTPYFVIDGRATFVSNSHFKDSGEIPTGVTAPHNIVIPPRPFMAQTYDVNRMYVDKKIKSLHNSVISGKMTAFQALDLLGVDYVGKTKDQITNGKFEANKPATKRAKGSSRPLIDSGHLRSQINHEVVGA